MIIRKPKTSFVSIENIKIILSNTIFKIPQPINLPMYLSYPVHKNQVRCNIVL